MHPTTHTGVLQPTGRSTGTGIAFFRSGGCAGAMPFGTFVGDGELACAHRPVVSGHLFVDCKRYLEDAAVGLPPQEQAARNTAQLEPLAVALPPDAKEEGQPVREGGSPRSVADAHNQL